MISVPATISRIQVHPCYIITSLLFVDYMVISATQNFDLAFYLEDDLTHWHVWDKSVFLEFCSGFYFLRS
ncbi:hypothetical protein CW304_21275 [Bacillus sp. UFRGS-B20]|nr:hypothetical protein CW304_21275 [Bacillus sp. UFRGS-B20]